MRNLESVRIEGLVELTIFANQRIYSLDYPKNVSEKWTPDV